MAGLKRGKGTEGYAEAFSEDRGGQGQGTRRADDIDSQ